MTVVCLVILAGIFWGDFFLKNYIESHVDEREEREICRGEFLIRKHHNKGMMLNAGQKRRRLVAVVSLAFTLILTVVFIVSLDKFDKAYENGIIDKVLTTNLIYQTPELLQREWYINCDMSKYIAYIIDTLNHDSSISDLLNPNERIQNIVAKYKTGEL